MVYSFIVFEIGGVVWGFVFVCVCVCVFVWGGVGLRVHTIPVLE